MNKLESDMKKIFESSSVNDDLKRENANINGDTSMGIMLQVGSAASKDFFRRNYITEEQLEAFNSGKIHIHDFDFYGHGTLTCCQIDIQKLFKDGFHTGHGSIREPKSVSTYAALACIALQSNQNEHHGGQSIPNFDYALAEGVRESFVKHLFKVAEIVLDKKLDKDFFINKYGRPLMKTAVTYSRLIYKHVFRKEYDEVISYRVSSSVAERIAKRAIADTEKETYQSMESLIHNLNTMQSRAGGQTPFSSINYGLDTSHEGRLVIRSLLNATKEGLGNGETAVFPIQIFRVKEGINYNKEDPNYDLLELACETTAKRLFPNFCFIDAPFNLAFYEEGKPETEVAMMGCRTRVMSNVYDKSKEISFGRGNTSFTSINLPRIAIESEKNIDKFYDILTSRLELVASQLYDRLQIQGRKKVYNFPFLMGQGIWEGSDLLNSDDEVMDIIKHGSLSIGFIGLAETLSYIFGKHHGESEESQKEGLKIIKFMRDFCDTKAEETKLNYSLLATPAEGLSGTFIDKDRKEYGIIEGLTDKEYYTNSFHIPVWYPINAFEKLELEAPYHAMTNAGHISYVELDGDLTANPYAILDIIRCMKENGIGYGSINHPVDRDPVCGYVGIIGETCPRCGRKNGEEVSLETLLELKKLYRNMPYIPGI